MKKLFAILISVVLVVSLCSVFASAEGGNLVPDDTDWFDEPCVLNGNSFTCKIKFEDGKAVVYEGTPGTWPAIYTTFDSDKCIVADIDSYSLNYDFVVEGGETNISFLFSYDTEYPDNGFTFPISNTALRTANGGNVKFNTGSGDLESDHYKGVIKLSDLVNSKTNFDNSAFDTNRITENNELIFSGVRIYSVNNGVITINALEIVANNGDEPSVDPGDNSNDEPGDVNSEDNGDVTSEEPVDASDVINVESGESNSKAEASNASSGDLSTDSGDEGGFPYWIIAVVAVVMIGAVVAVVTVGKKKK